MKNVEQMLEGKGHQVLFVPPDATVFDALKLMAEKDVGALVPAGDAAALADAMEKMLSDHARYDPERLRSYALERFSWERVTRDTVALYREALGQAPS